MPGDTAVEAPVGDNDKKIDEPVVDGDDDDGGDGGGDGNYGHDGGDGDDDVGRSSLRG